METMEQALFDAMSWVDRMAPTPGQRELRTRLDQYRRVLEGWAISPPSSGQRQALSEQIEEVRRIARSTAPTRRRRVRPES
jgi:hypothetical protein